MKPHFIFAIKMAKTAYQNKLLNLSENSDNSLHIFNIN
uniref:Uncharacterized protein n=1 Tax=Arundo donax TaxID=35708 RepID=A0A0A9AW50_ARUDO